MKKLILLFLTAISLHANSQTVIDEKLNRFIEDWVGTPYRYGGKSKKYGIDCSQFNKRLYKDVFEIDLANTCRDQWKSTSRVIKDSLRVGDLVFFNSRTSPSGWHCGIFIGQDAFIHASNYRTGVKISSLSESMYKRIYKGAGRL